MTSGTNAESATVCKHGLDPRLCAHCRVTTQYTYICKCGAKMELRRVPTVSGLPEEAYVCEKCGSITGRRPFINTKGKFRMIRIGRR